MDGFAVHEGWAPGAIGGVAALHARHYAESHGFGAVFEAKVAAELGVLQRMDPARGDLFRWAMGEDGRVLGSIALDAAGADTEGYAHLRWFMLGERLRGRGVGRAWLDQASDAARVAQAPGVYL